MKLKFLALIALSLAAFACRAEEIYETLLLAPFRIGKIAVEGAADIACITFDPQANKVVDQYAAVQPVDACGRPVGEPQIIKTGYRRVITDRRGNQRIYHHDNDYLCRPAFRFEYRGPVHY